jgi:hypothetical protein
MALYLEADQTSNPYRMPVELLWQHGLPQPYVAFLHRYAVQCSNRHVDDTGCDQAQQHAGNGSWQAALLRLPGLAWQPVQVIEQSNDT